MKTAIVTGGSSGIGLEVVNILAEKGYRVYEFSRRKTVAGSCIHISVDVTDEASVKDAVAQVANGIRNTVLQSSSVAEGAPSSGDAAAADSDSAGEEGCEAGIDLLINCAGCGISGAVEFTEIADARRQMDVNFMGTVIVNQAVLPYMRKQGYGRIVNVGSMAGIAPIPFQAFYSASKSAINIYTMVLANEVKPYGITATVLLPGDTKTGFTAARKKSAKGDDEYGGRISRSVSQMERDEQKGASAESAAAYIVKIALKKSVKPMYSIGFISKAEAFLIKFLPARTYNFIIGKMYDRR